LFKFLAFILYAALTIICVIRFKLDTIGSLLFIGTSIAATLYASLEWDDKLTKK
jgi:TM2 domain-containing membrane protein YozV